MQWAGVALTLCLWPGRLEAQGGPPLLTDDPDTPGPGYWEINLTASGEIGHAPRVRELPLLDANYGVGRRLQLKAELPWLSRTTSGGTQQGTGDLELGVKWRFLGEEGRRLAWAVYPQYAFAIDGASARRGLIEGGHAVFLPTEITLEWHRIELNLEVGRLWTEHERDSWLWGLASELSVGHRFELVSDLHEERPDHGDLDRQAEAGFRELIGRRLTAMGAIARSLTSKPPHSRITIGLQLEWPGRYAFANSHS